MPPRASAWKLLKTQHSWAWALHQVKPPVTSPCTADLQRGGPDLCHEKASPQSIGTGVGGHSLLWGGGIFPTRGSNPRLPRPRRILDQLCHQGSPMEDPAELNNKGTSKIIYFLQTAQEEAISLENSTGDVLASAGHSSERHPNVSSAALPHGCRMERGSWQELTEAHLQRQFLKSAEDCVKALEEEYEDSGVFRVSTIPWTPHASCHHFLGLKSGHRPDVKGAPHVLSFSKIDVLFLGLCWAFLRTPALGVWSLSHGTSRQVTGSSFKRFLRKSFNYPSMG